jgi:hypothetical protein
MVACTRPSVWRHFVLGPHDRLTARIARGLEPALIDNEHVTIGALKPGDPRRFELRVAGPAALLTAKAIKISERLEQADTQPDRLKEKDAFDAFRILQAIDTPELARGFAGHREDEHAAGVTAEAIEVYRTHASTPARSHRTARCQRRPRRPHGRASIRCPCWGSSVGTVT